MKLTCIGKLITSDDIRKIIESKQMKLVKSDNPVLRKRSKKVITFDSSILKLGNDLFNLMIKHKAVGISAVQCGVLKRVCIVGDGHKFTLMVNPEIIWESEEKQTGLEGCISFEGLWLEIERPQSVKVKYQDETGKICFIDATGLLARCAKHEIEHLSGQVFTDLRKDKNE